jgi:hypothetical protein
MTDSVDWSVTTWEGNRLRQHREYLALPFRKKLEILEQLAETAARLTRGGKSRGELSDSPGRHRE